MNLRNRRQASLIAASIAAFAVGGVLVAVQGVVERRDVAEGEQRVVEAAQRLGDVVHTVASGGRMRADSLSVMPALRAAIETDAATVRDMARADFAIAAAPNETTELFQIPHGDAALSLLRVPDTAAPLLLEGRRPPAVFVQASGEGLSVTSMARVIPLYKHQRDLGGAVAVSSFVALRELREVLAARGMSATLEGLDQPLSFGSAVRGAATVTARVPLVRELTGQELTLRAALPAPSKALRTVGWLLLLCAVVLLVAARVHRGLALLARRAPASREMPAVAVDPERRAELPTLPGLDAVLEADLPPPMQPLPAASDDSMAHAAAVLEWNGGGVAATPLPQLVPTVIEDAHAGAKRIDPDSLIAGKYHLIRKLASSMTAEVFLAECPQQRECVVKILRPGFDSPAVSEDALDEARSATQLRHPNVVQVLDVGPTQETWFVAMEYVDGCDAATLVSQLRAAGRTMPLAQALGIVVGVCEALSTHTFNCDVKPSNVLVTRDGSAKLDVVALRPQFGGRISSVDVNAVGMLLYQLTTGAALRTATPSALRPSQLRPDLPPELDELVWRALRLAPEADGSYATVAELAADLRALERSAAISASAMPTIDGRTQSAAPPLRNRG